MGHLSCLRASHRYTGSLSLTMYDIGYWFRWGFGLIQKGSYSILSLTMLEEKAISGTSCSSHLLDFPCWLMVFKLFKQSLLVAVHWVRARAIDLEVAFRAAKK